MATNYSKNKDKKKPAGNTDRRNIWLLIATTLLVVVSIILFVPPQDKINQGLDIQGGLSVVLTAKNDSGEAISSEDMEKSRAIIESRVNALGASEATVQLQGTDQILVQIPGLSDAEQALNTIGKVGKLEFARLDSFTDSDVKTKIENGEYGNEATITDSFGYSFSTGKTNHLTVKDGTYTPLVTGENITKVTVDRASETSTYYAVDLSLDSAGTTAFAQASKDLYPTNGQIVIILDNEVQSAPAVQSEILGGQVSITGNYTLDEAKALQTVLESGSLPVSFEFAQSQVVGPTLGQDALAAGVLVMLIGLALVMVYLLVFYGGLGILTAAAMMVFAAFYLGILALLSSFGLFSLSLAGVAGVVLTIGMAADSSILTIERFREEIRMGRSIRAASITGVKHGIMTSIDADLVSLVSALTLFFLASASVKGFGMTLALGIICDIIMMLLFKAPIIRVLAPHVMAKNPGFWGLKDCQAAAEYAALDDAEQPMEGTKPAVKGRFIKKDINFLGYRRILLGISAVLVVVSLGLCGFKGLNFGIEFVGGTSVAINNTGDITTDQVRSAFTEAGEPDAVIQTTSTNGNPGFLVRTTTTSAETAAASAQQVVAKLGLSTDSFEVSTIGPDWGASVIQSSLIAFLVSLVLIIIYIAIRFEYKMGVCAIIALLHDLLIVVGVYALFGREITPNTIAALLTILGYSLYDTVVVFHRINDNMKEEGIKCTFMSMANHSINNVIIRSVNTTLTSIIPVIAMLIFGSATLQDFAFAMVIGLLCGAYSSIAVASPIYAIWKTREKENARRVKRYGTDVAYFVFGKVQPAGYFGAGADEAAAATKAPVAVVEAGEEKDAEKDASKEKPAKSGKGKKGDKAEPRKAQPWERKRK